GPGDPELLTMKGYKALQEADVVLYDNLANKELLKFVREDCEKQYVGKLPYGEYTPQETIHELIREKAFSKGKVVRLKGGDPFIFGRGFEEILFARKLGIRTSYIPGISTMQASGLEDVPLTHRNISEGFWVMTGTKKDGSLTRDLQLAIQSRATVVIYMGMKKLHSIMAIYRDQGAGDMPAIIIQHATLPNQKIIRGPIKDLPALADEQRLSHPAIIIIGNVVNIENIQ
ncbi:MAG TPA: uroporphyrinogen-III C-methyltransferase, partial [Chitinophagaceae bacterium]|nr:uroporphyrinogen-III C-methyltransferase [Chitinophagaceae bacterium]